MAKQLNTQLNNRDEIKDILRELNISSTFGGQPIETLLIYLPCKNDKCDTSGLFKIIKNSLLMNFALSYKDIREKLDITEPESVDLLFKKAVRKISKKTAHGELGELLLFTLLDVYLGAPKILSKLTFKTSRRMPVFGADAVHAQYIDNNFRLYFGESKLHQKFSNASTDAIESIEKIKDNFETEFDLISDHIDFPNINEETKADIVNFLNPFIETTNELDFLHSPCFIGFEKSSLFTFDTDIYLEKYKKAAKGHINTFYRNLGKNGLDVHKTILMLLPFSSIDELVKQFVDYMGINA